jgi:hypothetical protein
MYRIRVNVQKGNSATTTTQHYESQQEFRDALLGFAVEEESDASRGGIDWPRLRRFSHFSRKSDDWSRVQIVAAERLIDGHWMRVHWEVREPAIVLPDYDSAR